MSSKKHIDGLTELQRNFCEEYLRNGYKVKEAYMAVSNAAEGTSNTNGYRLMKKPEVIGYIDKRRKEIFDSLMIDNIKINKELNDIAFDKNVPTKTRLEALKQLSKNTGLELNKVEANIKSELTTITVSITDSDE